MAGDFLSHIMHEITVDLRDFELPGKQREQRYVPFYESPLGLVVRRQRHDRPGHEMRRPKRNTSHRKSATRRVRTRRPKPKPKKYKNPHQPLHPRLQQWKIRKNRKTRKKCRNLSVSTRRTRRVRGEGTRRSKPKPKKTHQPLHPRPQIWKTRKILKTRKTHVNKTDVINIFHSDKEWKGMCSSNLIVCLNILGVTEPLHVIVHQHRLKLFENTSLLGT